MRHYSHVWVKINYFLFFYQLNSLHRVLGFLVIILKPSEKLTTSSSLHMFDFKKFDTFIKFAADHWSATKCFEARD
jgi:hypothetical protein